MSNHEWEPTRWYRVLDAAGRVWSESSDLEEVTEHAKAIGQPVLRLWREVPREEWRPVETGGES
jgi:hypothetical protein